MVSNVKCLLQWYWLWTNMVPLPHYQATWNQGYMNPFKLHCNSACMYIFSGERAQSFHKILTEMHDSRKFKGNWFILRPKACLLERKQSMWGSIKNVSISRAITHEGVWLLMSDSPKYQRVKRNSLILYMWPHNYIYIQKACSEGQRG